MDEEKALLLDFLEAGHLDAAAELLDGRQWIVLGE